MCIRDRSVSAKDGTGLEELLQQIVEEIPEPNVLNEENLQALIIDSWYDNYLGVVSLIRIFSGKVNKGDKFIVKSTGQTFTAESLGKFTPKEEQTNYLSEGEVGFLIANVKDLKSVPVGDTLVLSKFPETHALDGFEEAKPQVYASFYPVDSNEYQSFREALQKLNLNDAALTFEPESSDVLGSGFRCGFLGSLHMEVIKERLEREYSLELITTAPSVSYEILKTNGEEIEVNSPSELPTPNEISQIIERKKAIYNLSVDKKNQKFGEGETLNKVDLEKLPDYIIYNNRQLFESQFAFGENFAYMYLPDFTVIVEVQKSNGLIVAMYPCN